MPTPHSILNHALGPVIRGPSSSHTAGAYHIAALARDLLGAPPVRAAFTFDPAGSYAVCCRRQNADLAFAAGLLGWPMTDDRFGRALDAAAEAGLAVTFHVAPLPAADHPNTVDLSLESADGRTLQARARSIGGGAVEIVRLAGRPVRLTGAAHEVVVEVAAEAAGRVAALLAADGAALAPPDRQTRGGLAFVHARRTAPLPPEAAAHLGAEAGVRSVRSARPIFLPQRGKPLFASAGEMLALCAARNLALGEAALAYEAALLGLSPEAVLEEVGRRLAVMRAAVAAGLRDAPPPMQLLAPSAGRVMDAEAAGRLTGGLATRAAARALAAMHTASGGGVVCAAPTGGAAGVLPAVLATWQDERGLDGRGAALALLAAGAVGVVIANRATFAAEVAGCQVEIGAAGAMAAAACVQAAGGDARQAAAAAAVALQNTMGSVCDLVQGIVEIPCHTRNAAAAAAAFVCADLVRGGYANPVPLDETIDVVFAVGRMLPSELRCTALGGLAQAPSAKALRPRDTRA